MVPYQVDTTRRAWRKNIRDLYGSFERADGELELLREIDRSIIGRLDPLRPVEERSKSIEEVFLRSLERLAEIHGLREPGRCYVYLGDGLLPLRGGEAKEPIGLERIETVKRFARIPGSRLEIVSHREGEEALFGLFPDARTLLLQPLYESERLLAILVFADSNEEENSVLTDELSESVTTVARQLSIAYDHFMRAEQEERTHQLWNLFLNSDLAPTKCFKQLAEMARYAYPQFGPLRLEVPPEVQILVIEHTEGDEPHFMTIRGTTGEERVIEKIDIEKSISGLLVLDPELEHFCDDPRKPEYRDIYKSYLGNEAGTEIKSEFAVRLVTGGERGRLVGVLNLESGLEGAFNLHHRAAIKAFADRIAPMVETFEERIDHNRVMHLSVSVATARYLDSLASIFRHGVASPLVAFKGNVETAQHLLDGRHVAESDDKGIGKLEDVIRELSKVHDQIFEFTRDFAFEISGFGVLGRFDLRQLIGETVSLVQRSLLRTTEEPVEIKVTPGESANAFCSPLFKQHFFSVLTNAIYALQEKADWDSEPRLIEVAIDPYKGGDSAQEIELNRRWVVKVRDNGVGVDPVTLQKLLRFEPDSHYRKGAHGLGLGLVALQRYMASIGGWVELESIEGSFFEVRLLFDEYIDEIHGPLSTMTMNGGAAGNGA
jgi:signal transduction histidine kinase